MKPISKKSKYVLVAALILIIVAVDKILLYKYGLGDPPLYVLDEKIGYYPLPDQHKYRFGNHVNYNSLSLRGAEVLSDKGNNWRIVFLGDSVMNGGVQTDDKYTITGYLDNILKLHNIQKTQLLNASCGGWALENEYQFVLAHKFFDTDVLVLEINAGDLSQPFGTMEQIRRHPSFPTQAPSTATGELISRYLLPRLLHLKTEDPGVGVGENDKSGKGLISLRKLISDCRKRGIKIFIWYFGGKPVSVNTNDDVKVLKQKLEAICKSEKVPILNMFGNKSVDYNHILRDDIHPNAAGNELIANELFLKLQQGFLRPNEAK